MKKVYIFTKWYKHNLETRPLITKCTTSAAINFVGDAISQRIESKKKFDVRRSAIFTSLGFFYVAPLLHLNYTKILPSLVPAGTKFGALKKLAFD